MNGVTPDLCDRSSAAALSIEDQQRVALILDQYMIAVEEGRQPSADALLMSHPDLAPTLRECLDGLSLLRQAAFPNSDSGFRLVDSPRWLADYDLRRELGCGSMGIVYAAVQRSLGKWVAIKVLTTGGALDDNRLKRFQREAQAAAALNHPGIVSVFDVGCDGGTYFYVMQFVDGHSLDRHIEFARRGLAGATSSVDALPILSGPKRFREAARLIAEAAEAVHYAHLAGIVHRDIKPSNLLVDAEGRLRVTDFGLARVDSHGDLTRSGELIGTLRYMSPEQASGRGELVDGRADVYGLGATLYEAVTLRPAFLAEDGPTLLRAIGEGSPRSPRTIDPAIPRDLQTIAEKAMDPDRLARYQTARELAADLRRFLEGKPVLAKARGRLEKLFAWSRKNTGTLLASLGLVSIVAVGALLHAIALTAEQNRTKSAKELSLRNYRQARAAVDSLGINVALRLSTIPEADFVLRDILAETLSYYQQFIRSAHDDPSLRVDVTLAQLQIARIVSQSGSFEDAAGAYRAAIDALRSLQDDRGPLSSDYVRAVNELAIMHSEHGDQSAAMRLLGDLDHRAMAPSARALTLNNRGVVWLKSGEIDRARSEIAKAIELLKASPNNPRVKKLAGEDSLSMENLADSMCNMSVLLERAGELEQARELADRAVALRRATMDGEPASYGKLVRLAIAHSNLGALRWKAGAGPDAIADFQDAVDLLEQASRAAPHQVLPRRELAVALNNLAMVATSLGEYPRAESALERACKIADSEFQSDPKNAETACQFASILNNRAVLLQKLRRHTEADRLFASAHKHQSIAVELAPSSKSYRQSLEKISSAMSRSTK